jgi:hypothetical protein
MQINKNWVELLLLLLAKQVTSFSRKSNILIYEYKLCQSSMTRTDSIIKDLRVFLDSKHNFHSYDNYIFSQYMKLFGSSSQRNLHLLIPRTYVHILFNHSKVYAWVRLCCLEFYYVYRCQQTGTHPSEICRLCFNRFFPYVHYSYAYASEHLKLHILRKRRYHFDKLAYSSLPWF